MNDLTLEKNNGTFYRLLNSYGLEISEAFSGSAEQNGNNIATTPLYFARAGDVDLDYGNSRTVGSHAVYWYSTAGPAEKADIADISTAAYNLYIAENYFDLNRIYSHRYGFSVRCLVR